MERRYAYPTSYLAIIVRYLAWRKQTYGNKSVCFTYEGIFKWIAKHPYYKDIKKTTMERVIRKLVEHGYLSRVRERPHAIFCLEKKAIEHLKKFLPGFRDYEVLE